jgi:hypothetical protein
MADDEARGPDPRKSTQIAIVGKRGSGKTEIGYSLFDSFPYDRVLIDPNGDIKIDPAADVVDLEPPVPSRWPAERFRELQGDKKKPQTLRFVPQFNSDTYLEDMDRVAGLAFTHGRTCLFVDEAHELAPAGRVPPHMRRNLRQGRHNDLTMILATPRPLTVDPLVVANADWVYVFKLPNPNDRKRVAECIGYDPKAFDAAVHALGPFEYLRYDSEADDLAWFPALPPSEIVGHKAA